MIKQLFYKLPVLTLVLAATMYSCKHEPEIPEGIVMSYKKDIQPIFNGHCNMCHGVDRKAGLDFLTYEGLMKKIKPGKPEASEAYTNMSSIWKDFMPAEGKEPVPEALRQKLYIWIIQGAKDN